MFISSYRMNVPGRLLGTRFTNVVSGFEPGSQELNQDIYIEPQCRINAHMTFLYLASISLIKFD
jgi:hypothetical protein